MTKASNSRFPIGPLNADGDLDHYKDTGCSVAPACLKCPLPQCKYDDPAGYAKLLRLTLDRARVAVMEREGISVEEAAERFGMDVRNVYRMKRRVRLESDDA